MSSQRPKPNILIVDDDESISGLLEIAAQNHGWRPVSAGSIRRGLQRLTEHIKAVILDHGLPDGDSIKALIKLREKCPDVAIIILTGLNDAETAVKAMRAGADDYLTKPFEIERLFKVVQDACRVHRQPSMSRSADALKDFPNIKTSSLAMRELMRQVERVARLDMSVLITGESGTGKAMIAREVHRLSSRATEPFVSVSCPALPLQLLESEIFGHEKGAFTGSTAARQGYLEIASKGTIVLDEIAELPQPLQLKLLTFLQERKYCRLGGHASLESDARIISSTHVDLLSHMATGKFREDLYYRINIFELKVPPLRERLEDLPEICQSIFDQIALKRGCETWEFTHEALASLACQNWPGNIRQLGNVIERVTAFAEGRVIDVQELNPMLDDSPSTLFRPARSLDDMERQTFVDAYIRNGRNKARTARDLGVSERTIYNLLKRYKIP